MKSGTNRIPQAGKEDEVLTFLHAAALKGRKEVAVFLIDHGEDVNAATNKGFTPLHSAAINGHQEVAKLLLENGADPNARNSLGGAPLPNWPPSCMARPLICPMQLLSCCMRRVLAIQTTSTPPIPRLAYVGMQIDWI